jgi:hypothetical protein
MVLNIQQTESAKTRNQCNTEVTQRWSGSTILFLTLCSPDFLKVRGFSQSERGVAPAWSRTPRLRLQGPGDAHLC